MCRRAERRRADRSGFTLIEALVAFVVMATVLGVLYRGTVQTRAGAVTFSARAQEEAVALSLLDEFRARRELHDGSYSGDRDGRHWTLLASRMDLADQLPKGAEPARDKPAWGFQRLVLRVATAGRPLETEAVHLVRAGSPDPEAR